MLRRRLARQKQKAACKKRKKAVSKANASASLEEFDPWQNEAPVADGAYECPWKPEDDGDFDLWQAEKKNYEDSTVLQSQQSKTRGPMQAATLEAGSELLSASTEKTKQSQTERMELIQSMRAHDGRSHAPARSVPCGGVLPRGSI